MNDSTIIGLTVAYALIAVLLLSMNLTARWRWWVKGGAIAITSAFYIVTYMFIYDLLGWPSDDELPARFQLIWGKVVEPDKFTREPGHIYLWVEALDEFNFAFGTPRAFDLPYDEELARRVAVATGTIMEGGEVSGTAEAIEDREPEETGEMSEIDDDNEGGSEYDVEMFPDEPPMIEFGDMPAGITPDKEVI